MLFAVHVTVFALFVLAHCAHAMPEATSAYQRRGNSSSVNNGKSFNLMLVEQHPATVCSLKPPMCDKDKVINAPNWTISYLWPLQLKSSACDKYTPQCSGLTPDEIKILRQLWPTLLPDDAFEPLQWWANMMWNILGIGRCIHALAPGVFPTCHPYFTLACTLHSRINIAESLSNANITPSNQAYYGVSEIQEAFNTSVILGCEGCSLSRIGVCFTCAQLSPSSIPECNPVDCDIPLPGAVLPWNKFTLNLKKNGVNFQPDSNCGVRWCDNHIHYKPKD